MSKAVVEEVFVREDPVKVVDVELRISVFDEKIA